VQRIVLLGRLARNQQETDINILELDTYQQSDHCNYQVFMESLTTRRRMLADMNSHAVRSAECPSGETATVVMGTTTPLPPPSSKKAVYGRGRNIPACGVAVPDAAATTTDEDTNIEEFVPDERIDRSFLDDPSGSHNPLLSNVAVAVDSDSDEQSGNPLVCGLQEDLDVDNEIQNIAKVGAICRVPVAGKEDVDTWTDIRRSPDGGEDTTVVAPDMPKGKEQGRERRARKSKLSKKSCEPATEQDKLEDFLNG